jgi:hypothetical protein
MHFIDIKLRDNNKEIYKLNTLLNTIVQYEAPHAKREIPQCMRCQILDTQKIIAETTQDALSVQQRI